MGLILALLCLVLNVYYIVLIIRIVLSWIPSVPEPVQPIARGVRAVTDPLLIPLRGVIPSIRMGAMALDVSPIVLFVAIVILQRLVC
ncbi:MAG TPA: YggT family protein [Euzebyales bacterium]